MRASEFIPLEEDMQSGLKKIADIIKMEIHKPNPQRFILDKLMRLTNNHDENKILQLINKACQVILNFPNVQAYAQSLQPQPVQKPKVVGEPSTPPSEEKKFFNKGGMTA